MRDTKFHAHVKQQVKLRILISKFLDRKLKEKIFSTEGQQVLFEFQLFLICEWM